MKEDFRPYPVSVPELFEYSWPVLLDESLRDFLEGSKIGGLFNLAGVLVGYIIIEGKGDHQDILFMEVDENYRGRGLGRLLLANFLEPKPTRLLPLDPRAKSFFEHMVECGQITDLLMEDQSVKET